MIADEVPNQEPPQSPQEKLTKFFEVRPSVQELEERNILKDIKIAPAIQSAKVHHGKVVLILG
jgi:RPEL repeat